MTVKNILDEYRGIAPYLIVQGAEAAIQFYKKAFGATEHTRLVMPDGKIGHAEIRIGDSVIMLGDESPGMGFKSPQLLGGSPVSIHLYVENSDAFFARAIAAGAIEVTPLENMFYGDRQGKVKDPFGYTWILSTHVEDVSQEEQQTRLNKLYSS